MVSFVKFAPETEYSVISREHYLKSRILIPNLIPFDVDTPIQFQYKGLDMELDKEYYKDQVEFKIRALPYSKTDLLRARYAIKDFANDPVVWLIGNAPAYVWTHLHFWTTWEYPHLLKLRWTLFILEFFCEWFEKNIQRNNCMLQRLAYFELQRMLFNHNIWHYLDIELMGWKMVELLNSSFNKWYSYMWWAHRPKYQPIVFSPANDSGKPETLEVRAIPNTWYLTAEENELYEFTEWFKHAINSRTSAAWIKDSILIARLRMMSLYRSIDISVFDWSGWVSEARWILSTRSNHYGFPKWESLYIPNSIRFIDNDNSVKHMRIDCLSTHDLFYDPRFVPDIYDITINFNSLKVITWSRLSFSATYAYDNDDNNDDNNDNNDDDDNYNDYDDNNDDDDGNNDDGNNYNDNDHDHFPINDETLRVEPVDTDNTNVINPFANIVSSTIEQELSDNFSRDIARMSEELGSHNPSLIAFNEFINSHVWLHNMQGIDHWRSNQWDGSIN